MRNNYGTLLGDGDGPQVHVKGETLLSVSGVFNGGALTVKFVNGAGYEMVVPDTKGTPVEIRSDHAMVFSFPKDAVAMVSLSGSFYDPEEEGVTATAVNWCFDEVGG